MCKLLLESINILGCDSSKSSVVKVLASISISGPVTRISVALYLEIFKKFFPSFQRIYIWFVLEHTVVGSDTKPVFPEII